MAEKPSILVSFVQKAASFIQRSQRGVAILVIRDDTDETPLARYASIPDADADAALYTSENLQAIRDMLTFGPYLGWVVRIGSDGTLSDALTRIERSIKTGWIGIADPKEGDAAALVSWIKAREARQTYFKAVVHQAAAPDTMHVVNLKNETVTFTDARGTQTGAAYIPSLLGIFAACSIKRGATNYLCANLKAVSPVDDEDKAIADGFLTLFNADVDEVRILAAVNSMTTTNGTTRTEDMQYIETVEAMDMIADDIRTTFRDTYLGNYKNNLDNQMLFIAAVNGYFRELSQIGTDVLDREYANAAQIDVDAQRAAWEASGKAEAAEWDEDTVRRMAFKRSVFIAADIKVLGSMENLRFVVNMM